MRRLLLITLAILLFAGIVGGTATYSLALNAPYVPGEPLFSTQLMSERLWSLTFNTNEADRAGVLLDILARRLDDLTAVQNTPHELAAVSVFDEAFIEAALAIGKLPPETQQPLRERLSNMSQQALARLDALAVADDTAVTSLRAKLQTALALLNDVNADITSVVLANTVDGQGETAVAANFSGNALDDPRSIPFPPNADLTSAHSFFPITDGHGDLQCSACHTGATYQGADPACVACHADDDAHNGSNGADCALCHTIASWQDASFDHSVIGTQDCSECHEPPPNHYAGACRDCHTDTTDFSNAVFNHAAIGSTDCSACHTAPANHYAGACRDCHSDTTNFSNAVFNHATIGSTDCSACHTAPANHYAGACRDCHSDTTNFSNAVFNHATIGSADCSACHTAPANHYAGACRDCHTDTTNFKNASFNHATIGGTDCSACHSAPVNHYPGACRNCHVDTGNFRNVNFNHAGLTNCQGCHTPPPNHFAGQCSDCHSTTTFGGATFNHTFPVNHKGANGECAKCHPGGNTATYTCYTCHDQQETIRKHNEEGIGNIANCVQCHANGKENDGGDDDKKEDGGDDDDD